MASEHKVFVYGTLRPWRQGGYAPATHFILGYKMYSAGSFPYITPDNDECKVRGNILVVNDEELTALDEMEGLERGLYTRETVYAWDVNGQEERVLCNVYVAGPLLLPNTIESGDWDAYQRALFS